MDKLKSTNLVINDKNAVVKHHLVRTIVDRKAIIVITHNALIKDVISVADCNTLNYCLRNYQMNEHCCQVCHDSILIRFQGCMLNLSYKLKLCKWQASGTEYKSKVKLEKKRKQHEFKGNGNVGSSAKTLQFGAIIFQLWNYGTSPGITGISKNIA